MLAETLLSAAIRKLYSQPAGPVYNEWFLIFASPLAFANRKCKRVVPWAARWGSTLWGTMGIVPLSLADPDRLSSMNYQGSSRRYTVDIWTSFHKLYGACLIRE